MNILLWLYYSFQIIIWEQNAKHFVVVEIYIFPREDMSAKCIVLESSLATDPIQVVVSYLLEIKYCFTDLFHKI